MRISLKLVYALMVAGNFLAESAWANSNGHINARPETVQLFFALQGAPVLAEIARCESEFRHLDDDGQVLKNPSSSATGVMQITTYWHSDTAATLGLDLYEFRDNMLYALHLYHTQGLEPWTASKKCWRKRIASPADP